MHLPDLSGMPNLQTGRTTKPGPLSKAGHAMAENTSEVLVGGVVLAAAIGFAIYGAQVAGLCGTGSSD